MNLLTDMIRSAAREVGRQIARDLYRAAVGEVSRALPGSARRQPTPRPAGVRAGRHLGGYASPPEPVRVADLPKVPGGPAPGAIRPPQAEDWRSLPMRRCMFVPSHSPHSWRDGEHRTVLCRG